jgi:hypothetical protein
MEEPLKSFIISPETPFMKTFTDQKNYCLHLQGRRITLVGEDGTTTFTRKMDKSFTICVTHQQKAAAWAQMLCRNFVMQILNELSES